MTVSLWRIATEARHYAANDMSGAGAEATGGRWNETGVPMLYCSGSIALAVLETLSHLQTTDLPFNRCIVRFDVPDEVWQLRLVLDPLPGGWNVLPHGISSCASGSAWIVSMQSALLMVPSVIVPEEFNVLINPVHRDSAKITSTTVRRWDYDSQFF